jgi:putative tryptophan/tyrosine transport system substrate-binding protein
MTMHVFGPFRLGAKNEILFLGSEPMPLGRRAVALLRVLVERSGEPISKEALIDAAWPGLAVEDSNLTVQIAALRRALGTQAGGEGWIETLPRRGYRFVGEVREVEEEQPRARRAAASPSGAIATVVPRVEAERHHLTVVSCDLSSIAVLPFVNLSADPEQEYFADGISADIITGLSKLRWLFVIARNSSFSYKGKAVDVKRVSRELGVRYVLEGSVRKDGNRVRITAQLIDAATGNYIWADHYDGELSDVFSLQDEITRKAVAAIEPSLLKAESLRSQQRSAEDLDAWDMVMAHSTDRVRVIGILSNLGPDDPETKARTTLFEQSLQQLGWAVGCNLKIETRAVGPDLDLVRPYAAQLAALAPDALFCIGSMSLAALQRATRAIPIVFLHVPDPVGAGFVQSMAHPGANITGFSHFDYSIGGKWAELLKQIAPQTTRVLVLRDTSTAGGIGQFAAVRSVAQTLGIELTPVGVRDADEIQRNLAAFARSGNGGVIVTTVGIGVIRKLIISLVDRYKLKLPTIYPYRYFAVDGGLVAYGPSSSEQIPRAAGYIDRILRGEKPADLPVQAATKYELVVNLKTAKALGIDIPSNVLALADEVIE